MLKKEDAQQLYSDGSVEEEILNYLQQHSDHHENIIEALPHGAVFHNFTNARTGLLRWYPFSKEEDILEIGAGMGALTPYLATVCKQVTALEPSPSRAKIIAARCQSYSNVQVISGMLSDIAPDQLFDKVLLIGVLEYAAVSDASPNPWLRLLQDARAHLKPGGKLLIAIENRFGLKYWCGAAEDHTGIPFDSINDYQQSEGRSRNYNTGHVRTFSGQELELLLCDAGLSRQRFYYPLPDYKFPMLILSDDSLNGGTLSKDVKYTYPEESLLIADERNLIPKIIDQGYLRFFANSFFIEAMAQDIKPCAVTTALMKRDYAAPYQLDTVMEPGVVRRRASGTAALRHLRGLEENTRQLLGCGISCVNQICGDDGASVADYIAAPRADAVFTFALQSGDMYLVSQMLEQLRAALLKSSTYEIQGNGIILREGFLDLTFRNSFWIDGALLFFDQEWKATNVPLNYLLFRSIQYTCGGVTEDVRSEIFQACGITQEQRKRFSEREKVFLNSLMDSVNCHWFDGLMYQDRLTVAHKLSQVHSQNEELAQETEHLRGELQCKEGHVELLLQSERDLQAEVSRRERVEKSQAEELTQREHIERIQAEELARRERVEKSQAEELARLGQIEQNQAAEITQLTEQISTLDTELVNKTDWVEELLQSERDLQNEVARLRQEVLNKGGHIQQLLVPERELCRIKASRSWRFMGYVWKMRDMLIPQGSKRRLVGRMTIQFVKHPLRFLGKCSPKRVGKFFATLRREGAEGVSRRLDDCLIGNALPQIQIVVEAPEDGSASAPEKIAADYAVLYVPQWEKPAVSIVIPVYNQFAYTYACVKSILENSGDMTYELLIADDCSTDLTREIDQIIHGLRTIHNPENLRFLRNCNHAAKQAQGEYILFLNNDTQVQANWLAPLVELLEQDETIGMTGSKLVYPDGRLQEAGGIFWKDGSAWNYGNRSNPDEPEYNYVKDVDYISGAAICIRGTLWDEIGGFDERFSPAYCEDSDLAFEVRKHGKRVVYQPLSVVVHFEGVSNGTDTSTGQKAYQVVNQKKFYEKWMDVLEAEHFSNGENVFLARDRSGHKKTVLMVDHYVPMYDKDAGSRTVYQYIRLLTDMGYNVKFIGDNFFPHQPYTQKLQQMGVEVLYGPYYANHWKDWIKENGASIGYAFLNRPHIAPKYIDETRKYTPAKIVYYGHDLHFLRELREYELTGDEKLLKSSEDWKKQELLLMRKADVAYYPSCVEEEEIKRVAPEVNVKAIPAYLFTEVCAVPFLAETRKDVMFIGGFGHRPNVDAVHWLAEEILPKLVELLPEIVIHILGSNPPEEIQGLANEHLRIAGFVTDEELVRYYRECRLSLVPLRYGAGIKGKVVEAMRYGLPVVTTSVGAEGIVGAEAFLTLADDAEEFAQKVASLYQDGEALSFRSEAYYRYIQEYFSPENAKRVIGSDFDMD